MRAISCSCHPWSGRSGGHAPLFNAKTGRRAAGFEVGSVDHYGLLFTVPGSKPRHYLRGDTFVATALPAAAQSFKRPKYRERVAPAKGIAIDEENTAQHPLLIDLGLTVNLREKRSELSHLIVGPPIQLVPITVPCPEP